jgi:hypothetical protein
LTDNIGALELPVQSLVSAMFLVVAIIHLLPVSGVFGAKRLAALYGISFNDPNQAILMRHRAVLFGLLGAFLALLNHENNDGEWKADDGHDIAQ